MKKSFIDNLFIKTEDKRNFVLTDNSAVEQDRKFEFVIDLSNPTDKVIDSKALFVKGDRESSVIVGNIVQYDKPFNLTGYTVSMNIKENKNDLETYICQIESPSEGKIIIKLPSRYVDENGECVFEISLQKGTKVIISQMYSYKVLDSLGEGDMGTETQMSALQQLIQQVQDKVTNIDDIVTELEVTQADIDDILGMIGGL